MGLFILLNTYAEQCIKAANMHPVKIKAPLTQGPFFHEVAPDPVKSQWRAGYDMDYKGLDLEKVSWHALSNALVRKCCLLR